MSSTGKKRVFSLNLHGLGDFIMSMPVLKALKQNGCYDGITVMVWPAVEEFARSVPFIDEVIALPKDKEQDPALSDFIRELTPKGGFNLVLDFSFMPRAGIITKAASAKRTMGFGIDLQTCPWYTDSVPNHPQEHRLQRNYHLLELLGIKLPERPDFTVTVSGKTRLRVDRLLAERGIDLEREHPIALHPGSGVSRRNWAPERFALLADMLTEHTGERVILLGGRNRTYDGCDESALAARVEAHMQRPVVNLAGCLSLPELVLLLGRCSLFVGNNSGPAHLAAAVARTPCLLVWAPRNEKLWRPVGAKVEIVFAESFCSEHCPLNQCTNMQYCLGLISASDVFERYIQAFAPGQACVQTLRREDEN